MKVISLIHTKHKQKDLLSEDVGENPTDHGDDGEEEEEDKVGEEEALDLLHRSEPAEAGEEDHQDGGDEDGVGSVHVQPVPQQLLQEGLVVHRPEAEGQKNYAAHLYSIQIQMTDTNTDDTYKCR